MAPTNNVDNAFETKIKNEKPQQMPWEGPPAQGL